MSYNANHYDAHADEDIVDVLTAISVCLLYTSDAADE